MILLRVWESVLVRTPSLTLGYIALKAIPGEKILKKKGKKERKQKKPTFQSLLLNLPTSK